MPLGSALTYILEAKKRFPGAQFIIEEKHLTVVAPERNASMIIIDWVEIEQARQNIVLFRVARMLGFNPHAVGV